MIVAEQQKFNKLQINSKTIRRLNGIRIHGPFVSVAVLYQLSYESHVLETRHFIEKICTYKDKSSRRTNIGPHQNSAVIKPAPANSIRTVEHLSATETQ